MRCATAAPFAHHTLRPVAKPRPPLIWLPLLTDRSNRLPPAQAGDPAENAVGHKCAKLCAVPFEDWYLTYQRGRRSIRSPRAIPLANRRLRRITSAELSADRTAPNAL